MTSPTEIPGFSGFVADLSLRERSVVPTEWTSEIVAISVRAALVEMRRVLDAPVEAERSDEDRAAMRARIAEIMAGLAGEKKEAINAESP